MSDDLRGWWIVPVTIADDRRVAVRAESAAEARQKVRDGKYARLGRSVRRGFLIVGEAEPAADVAERQQ